MPDNPHEMDLEQRRKQLEERRRLLEQRRQQISRARPGAEGAPPSPPAAPAGPTPAAAPPRPPTVPEVKPKPPTAPPLAPKEQPLQRAPAPPPRAPSAPPSAPAPPRVPLEPAKPKPEPAPRVGPAVQVPSPAKPPLKAPEPPVAKPSEPPPARPAAQEPAPKVEKAAPPAKPEIARAAAPPKKSGVPVFAIVGVVAVVVIVVAVLLLSGKKSEKTVQIERARADSIRAVQLAQARQDSLLRAAEREAASAIEALRQKLAEADRLQAATRAKTDYDQASAMLEEAVRLTSQGNFQLAAQRARAGTEHIDSAIDRSRRVQEREDLAKRDREQALARLQGEVVALQESLTVLKASGGSAYAGAQVQQLEQIVAKARQLADGGNLSAAQEQVSYAYDMASRVRFAIVDGERQKAEAEQRLAERLEKARQDSIAKARADSAAQAVPPTKAVAVKTVVPVYPRPALLAGITGTVEVEFEVGVDGKARDFKIVKSLGGGCDESAIEALKQWEFKPATQGGRPVPTRMRIPLVFKKS